MDSISTTSSSEDGLGTEDRTDTEDVMIIEAPCTIIWSSPVETRIVTTVTQPLLTATHLRLTPLRR